MSENVYYPKRIRHGAGCKVPCCVVCALGRLGEAFAAAGDACDRFRFAWPAKATLRTRGRRSAARGTTRRRYQGLREKVVKFPAVKP